MKGKGTKLGEAERAFWDYFGIITFGIITFGIITFGIITFGIITIGIITPIPIREDYVQDCFVGE